MRAIKKRKIVILAICTLLFAWLAIHSKSVMYIEDEGDFVKTAELAGYLQIVPLTPDETRAILLPEMGEYLTGKDVDYLFHSLRISAQLQSVKGQVAYEPDEKLSRRKWCAIYEQLLDTLGVADEVETVQIQYLGMLKQENRLMADNGNYDCDPSSLELEYGRNYEVYVWENQILGTKSVVSKLLKEQPSPENQADVEAVHTKEEDQQALIPEKVRVLLSQDNQERIGRERVFLLGSGKADFQTEREEWEAQADDVIDCVAIMQEKGSSFLKVRPMDGGRLWICDDLGTEQSSEYRGDLIVYQQDGQYWVVNEVDLESYLYGVVPGEMPESFAPEALKTQAICARTYACFQIAEQKYEAYHADLTDTTASQVYLPSKENEKCMQAVDDTAGKILLYEGGIANIYYYSTSCGFTSGMEVWQSEAVPYLKQVSLVTAGEQTFDESAGSDLSDPGVAESFLKNRDIEAYDSGSRFFRWEAMVNPTEEEQALISCLKEEVKRGAQRLIVTDSEGEVTGDCEKLGNFKSMETAKRSVSGAVIELKLSFSGGTVHVYNENAIRTILGAAMHTLKDKNGESVHTLHILPSAFFVAEAQSDGTFMLYGGGLGHGIGMSQYGADGMAQAGMTADEIIETFFPGTQLASQESGLRKN